MPGRRDVRRLCEILLGGDRIGQVGYDALPPLARDVYDRLEPLGLNLEQRGIQRALLDLPPGPSSPPAPSCCGCCATCCRPAPYGRSWVTVRLGERPIQEIWDLALGTHQRALIELGYEGVSIEQVLEQRLRRAAVRGAGDHGDRPGGGRGRAALTCAAAAWPTSWAPARWRCCRPSAASTARPRCCAGSGGCWPTTAPRAGAAAVARVLRRRPATRTTARCCPRRSTTRTPPCGRWRRCSASCSAWRAWRCRWAATAPSWSWRSPQSHPAGAGARRRCCGRRSTSWAPCPGLLRATVRRAAGNPLVVPAYPRYLSGFVHALDPVPGWRRSW